MPNGLGIGPATPGRSAPPAQRDGGMALDAGISNGEKISGRVGKIEI